MGCCSASSDQSARDHKDPDAARRRHRDKFQDAVADNRPHDALKHLGRLLVYYNLKSDGLELKRKKHRKHQTQLDAELEVFGLCAIPPGLGIRDRLALFIARFWSRSTERMMPVPCRGKQASLGLARALYVATGAITATILNILVMTFVCVLAGTPMFVWRSMVWIIITKPLLNYIPVLGAFLNFTGQPNTRATNRVETYLFLRSAFRHHPAGGQDVEKQSTTWSIDVMPGVAIDYDSSFLQMAAGKNAKKVDRNAKGGGPCCCASCC